MRSTILDDSKEDRAKFDHLLKDADVFFANKRPGYLESHGLDAEALCARKPGLIHARIVLHGDRGPWKNRPGFDEIGAAVSGLFCVEGTPTHPQSHAHVAPDLFTAETPLGTYQGLTDQVVMSRTPGSFRTVLVPRGSSKSEWLTH
jgi:crotonobetainyl-CoA:carnitine CoA-transferase CaiB-like acyl-CoA transferase